MTRNSIVGAGALIFVNAASGATTIAYHVWHDALGALGAGFVVGVLTACVPYYVVRELIGRHIRRPGRGIAATLYRKLDDRLDLDGPRGHRCDGRLVRQTGDAPTGVGGTGRWRRP